MSNLVPGITFTLCSMCNFSLRSVAEGIVQSLCNTPRGIRPVRFGPFDGSMPLSDPTETIRFLCPPDGRAGAGSLVLSAGKNCEYQVQWNKDRHPSFPFVGGFLLNAAFENSPHVLADFVSLVRTLALKTSVVYGDIRSMEVPGWDAPFNLGLRLPEIPNVSIYGEPYVELFGRERIESAPFLHIDRLSDDLYWLQATDTVVGPIGDEIRASIRKHLGEGAFMAGTKWRYKDGVHPDFSKYGEKPA